MLHVTLHAKPANVGSTYCSSPYMWDGRVFSRIEIPSGDLQRPLPSSFDDTLERLQQIARCYTEPDGSVLWTSDAGPHIWQIDGQLNDSAAGLMTIELKLNYVASAREAMQAALENFLHQGLGAKLDDVIYQLVRPGIYVQRLIL